MPALLPAIRWRHAGVASRIFVLALGLLAPHAPPTGADSSPAPGGRTESVAMKNFEFSPRTITIGRGGTVRWTNADVANHQISSGIVERGGRPQPDGRVSSPLLVRGDVFSATYPRAGEYPYYCAVHPFMRGMILVK